MGLGDISPYLSYFFAPALRVAGSVKADDIRTSKRHLLKFYRRMDEII